MSPRAALFTLGLFLLCCVVAARVGRQLGPKYTDWRLPRSLLPRKYQLRLLPFLENGNFTTDGRVEILLECMEETQLIVLNIADIAIVKDGLQVYDLIEWRRMSIQSYVEDKTRQLLIIGMKNETFQIGKFYRLTIQFHGMLNENLNGFYRSSYTENGVKKYMATTQFSPTDARRAFPCFDEPGMKAKFQVTLGRHKSRMSHSNMPIKRTVPHEMLSDYVWDEYETTLPMSTYILAFIVSEMEGSDPVTIGAANIQFRLWTRPSASKQIEYSRSLSQKVLRYLEDYFNISFPLPKLDMFAIPDFAVSGMENWGLITFRETALLFDPVRSSTADKQAIARVLSHEIAHQWFGNLVTMAWWEDLWLKEGFSEYLVYVTMDAVDTLMGMGPQFTVRNTQHVFKFDALENSHPMSVPVNKRNEVNELFDDIPYFKGPAVIRMLASFLGQPTFRAGLTEYLNQKKYKNAVRDDLWNALGNRSAMDGADLPADLKTIMDSWSLQSGYPVVTVRRDYDNQTAIVTQERFFLLKEHSSNEFPLWWIPLTFTIDFNATYSAWMLGTEDGIELELPASANDWIVFNVDQVGYYRVNYDKNNWQLIIKQLKQNHNEISVLNRAQLIDDSFTIARTDALSYSVPFEMSHYLRAEREFVPWRSALSAFSYLDSMLFSTPMKTKFREYAQWLIRPVFEEIGFNQRKGDSPSVILNRNQIIAWACRLDINECVQNATLLYSNWMNEPDKQDWAPPDYKETIACAAIAHGGDEEWDFALERYLSTDVSTEKQMLLNALSCSNSPEALNTLLEWALDGTSGIRRQDARNIFRGVSDNPAGSGMAFDFVEANWDKMVKSFPSLSVLGRIVDTLTQTLKSEDHLQKLTDLSEGKRGDLGTASRSIRLAAERTLINSSWMKQRYNTLANLLKSWSQNASKPGSNL